MSIRFSVVIPTCARPELLAECLTRLAPGAQSLDAAAYEVIVTDDGRDDVSKKMIAQRFPWARWTQGPRRGPASNRNHGSTLARGAWLVFTDDDCVPTAGWLAGFADAVAQGTDVEILEGRTTSDLLGKGPFVTAPVNESGGWLWSCNFAILTECFRRVGGFDQNFPAAHLEDVDFRTRALSEGFRMKFIAAATVVHPPRKIGPITRQVSDFRAYFYFARKHRVSLAASGLSAHALLRGRWAQLRRSRTPVEALRFCGRSAIEIFLLLPRCAWWAFTYKPVK